MGTSDLLFTTSVLLSGATFGDTEGKAKPDFSDVTDMLVFVLL